MRPKAIDVKPLENYILLVKFDNGEEKEFDVLFTFNSKLDKNRCHRHSSARFLLLSAPILRVGGVKKVIKNLVFRKKCLILHSKIIIN